jgi:hypothetical protein
VSASKKTKDGRTMRNRDTHTHAGLHAERIMLGMMLRDTYCSSKTTTTVKPAGHSSNKRHCQEELRTTLTPAVTATCCNHVHACLPGRGPLLGRTLHAFLPLGAAVLDKRLYQLAGADGV